jgi:KaiC/GvpD/RAD55 family RecA-like ATPase
MDGRRRLPQTSHLTGGSHINEPELDMRRYVQVEPTRLTRVYGVIRKLISDGRGVVSPMRSIGRELEESWPTEKR